MVAAATVGVAVRTLLIVLVCVMVAAFAYVFAIGVFSSCFGISFRWGLAILTDFSISVVVIAAWVAYKESSWIIATILLVSMNIIGSLASCGYILMQFFKLSPEESSKDPLYFVLVRHHKRDVMGHTWGPSVVTARVIFSALGCLMLGALIYSLIVDVSSSHAEAFGPCILTYVADIYTHVVVLSVWIAYKESSWISAFLWILLLVCLGNIILCVYIVRQLFYLSPQQPVSLIIFSSRHRDLQSSDPLLMAHSNV